MNISKKLLLIATSSLYISFTALTSEKPTHQTARQYSIDKFDPACDTQSIVDLCIKEWGWLFNSDDNCDKVETCQCLIRGYYHNDQLKILHENGIPAGFVAYRTTGPKEGLIELLAIEEGFRGKGYGKALLEHSIKELCDKGITSIDILVKENNIPALHLYQNVGFKRLDADKRIYNSNDIIGLEYTLESTHASIPNKTSTK